MTIMKATESYPPALATWQRMMKAILVDPHASVREYIKRWWGELHEQMAREAPDNT